MRPKSNPNKVNFISLGCARNLVDTEVMLGLSIKAGYEVTDSLEKADFLVVNTCGFLEASRQESIDTIKNLFDVKKSSAKVIVAGCMVSKHKDQLKELYPDVHYFLGSGDMEKILSALSASEPGEACGDRKSYLEQGEVPRMISTPKHFAYLKIAEGCAKRCAFCIIPKIKGALKSKSIEQIKKEFHLLLDGGAKEIVLIAQDLGDFGKDREEIEGLETLLKELLKIDRPYWLRLLYLYPDEITDSLIQVMKSDPRLLPYLDMPLQHISDKVLKGMRRKTNSTQIKSIITRLRQEIPHVVIRTSLMVGFPGETDEDFKELCEFVKEYKLDNVGIFAYSNEKEASSFNFENQIPEDVKIKRRDTLAKLQHKVVTAINKKYIGQTLDVIVEGVHPESEYLICGRFYGQCPDIDGQVIINDTRGIKSQGQIVKVKITDVMGYDLVGGVVQAEKVKTKLSLV
jgi:ribosomal protein S12 methylthiotransferase